MAAAANSYQSRNRNNSPYEVESFTPFDSFNFERYSIYPNVVAFVRGYFSTRKHLFNPLKSLYDPFIQGITGVDGKKTYTDFYEWYVERNPTFGSKTDLYIPEYEIALVQICRDLLFVHSTGKYINSNNVRRKIENLRKTQKNSITRANINNLIKQNTTTENKGAPIYTYEVKQKLYGLTKISKTEEEEIVSLLALINSKLPSPEQLINSTLQVEAFKYNIFMEILYYFLQIMSFHINSTIFQLDNGIEEFKKFINQSFVLVYPTYMQIDFKTVLLLCASPVINFRLTNRFRYIHQDILPPINDLEHDVFFHGVKSHSSNFIFGIGQNLNSKQNIVPKYIAKYKMYIEKMNKLILLLKPYFDYNETDASINTEISNNETILVIKKDPQQDNQSEMTPDQIKVCYCLLLFMLFHEMDIKPDIVTYLKTFFTKFETFDYFATTFENTLQIFIKTKRIIRESDMLYIYTSTGIFSDSDMNSASKKYKFLNNINTKNVFMNFISLLFSLKERIIEILN